MRARAFASSCVLLVACGSFGDASKSPAGTPCPGKFCSSFDGATFDEGWLHITNPGGDDVLGSSLDRSEDAARTGRYFLRWRAIPGGHYGERNFLSKEVRDLGAPARVSLELGFRLTKANDARDRDGHIGDVEIAALAWGGASREAPDTQVVVVLEAGNTLKARVEVRTKQMDLAARVLNDASWHTIRLEMTFPPAAGDVAADFVSDGERWASHSFSPATPMEGDVQIQVGGTSYGGAWHETILDFDDVVLSAE